MKFKELAIISFVLLILSLAAVSASDLNQTTISHSSSDGSLIVDSVTDSSSDGSLAVDIPVTDSNDNSIINNHDSKDNSIVDDSTEHSSIIDDNAIDDNDGTALDIDDSTKDDSSIDNQAIDNKPIDNSPIDSDITDGDSIISNMTNDSPIYNFDDSPITLSNDDGYFQNLQAIIDRLPAGSTLILSRDYKANCSFQIDINKDITIYGQGHTLDCNGLCRAFDSTAGNIVLKDLKITNGYINSWVADDETNNGGAIWIGSNAKYTIENCNFTNCWADDMGGAIYNEGKNVLTVIDCLFNNNTVDDVNGGAIYSIPPVHIENSVFKNNHAYDCGGAINIGKFGVGTNGLSNIINCVFDSNEAKESGGAIKSYAHLFIDSCTFNSNKAGGNYAGGAISVIGNLIVENSKFTNNYAGSYGGAIYCGGNGSVNKCIFDSNKCDGFILNEIDGGAIFCNGANLYVNNSTFKNNFAHDRGGAIFANGNLYVNHNQADNEDYNTFFISNTVDSSKGGAIRCCGDLYIKNAKFLSNSAHTDGGAICISNGSEIIHCLFDNNKCSGSVNSCRGGAIFSFSTINSILDCIFTNNYAEDYGGAVYSEETVNVYNSTFKHNSAENHGGAIYGKNVNVNPDKFSPLSFFIGNNAVCDNGGAIYAVEAVKVFNAVFNSNEARVDGGAIFSKKTVDVDGCTFDSNRAMEAISTTCYGGGIRAETVSATNSVFKDNYAENHGGAIYADYISKLQGVSFIDNHAHAYGGAIYINKACSIVVSQCSFINNLADGEGGAIFLDSYDSKLSLNNNLFAYNTAKDGSAVFNYGTYGDIVHNWWGDQAPSKDNDVLIEWKFLSPNEHHVDVSPLKLALMLSSETVKVGDVVRATLYFVTSDGAIFTGDMPVDNIGFILPDGFEKVSNNYTMNSAFIEFKPNKAGTFTIKSDLFWQYTNNTLTVLEASALSGTQVNPQKCCLSNKLANPNLVKNIFDVCSKGYIGDICNGLHDDSRRQSGSVCNGFKSVSFVNGLKSVSTSKSADLRNQLNIFKLLNINHMLHLTDDFSLCEFDDENNQFEVGSFLNPTELENNDDLDLNSAFCFVLSLFDF